MSLDSVRRDVFLVAVEVAGRWWLFSTGTITCSFLSISIVLYRGSTGKSTCSRIPYSMPYMPYRVIILLTTTRPESRWISCHSHADDRLPFDALQPVSSSLSLSLSIPPSASFLLPRLCFTPSATVNPYLDYLNNFTLYSYFFHPSSPLHNSIISDSN